MPTHIPSIRAGDYGGVYRSPWDPEGVSGSPAGLSGWDNTDVSTSTFKYSAIGPGNPDNPSMMTFSAIQSYLSLLWGSIDSYNAIEFWKGGVLQTTLTDSDAALAAAQHTYGAAFVKIAGIAFDELGFFVSDTNAFEFANVRTAVPLPPALLLFGTGLSRPWLSVASAAQDGEHKLRPDAATESSALDERAAPSGAAFHCQLPDLGLSRSAIACLICTCRGSVCGINFAALASS